MGFCHKLRWKQNYILLCCVALCYAELCYVMSYVMVPLWRFGGDDMPVHILSGLLVSLEKKQTELYIAIYMSHFIQLS